MEAAVEPQPTSSHRGGADLPGRRGALNRWLLLTLPATAFLAIFFLWPLLNIATRSLTEPDVGIGNFVRVATTDYVVASMATTLEISALVTIVCLLIGYPYAYLVHVAPPRIAGLLLVVVLVPFWSSLLVRTYAWQVILRDTGILNDALIGAGLIDEPIALIRTLLGVVIGMTHILLPVMVLPIYASMRRVDPELGRAAANLGANPMTSFRRVFLPLTLPGIVGGCLLVFVVGLGFYITPAILGGPRDQMISLLIASEVQQLRWGLGSAMAVVLLALTFAVLAIAARLLRVRDILGGLDG